MGFARSSGYQFVADKSREIIWLELEWRGAHNYKWDPESNREGYSMQGMIITALTYSSNRLLLFDGSSIIIDKHEFHKVKYQQGRNKIFTDGMRCYVLN